MWCGVVWRDVMWFGVVWCGVAWCGVVMYLGSGSGYLYACHAAVFDSHVLAVVRDVGANPCLMLSWNHYEVSFILSLLFHFLFPFSLIFFHFLHFFLSFFIFFSFRYLLSSSSSFPVSFHFHHSFHPSVSSMLLVSCYSEILPFSSRTLHPTHSLHPFHSSFHLFIPSFLFHSMPACKQSVAHYTSL